MGKKHWAVMLVLGAIGCSKVNLPRLGEGGRVDAPTSTSRPRGRSSNEAMQAMLQTCKDLGASNAVSERRIAEYSRLQGLVREMSPILKNDPAAFQRAHREAFEKTNDQVYAFLKEMAYPKDPNDPSRRRSNPQGITVLNYFRQRMNINHIGYLSRAKNTVLQGDERDLTMMLNDVFQLPEGESCSNLYLDFFFIHYVMSLDPLGEVMFGTKSILAQPDTLGLSAAFNDESVKNAPAVIQRYSRTRKNAVWVTLFKWDLNDPSAAEKMNSALQALESRASGTTREGIVLDLRYAGGNDRALLQKFQDSAARGWGQLPIVLLTNASTRGVASIFAYNMAQHANVKALGTDEYTYGYGRIRTQQALSLVENVSSIVLTVGSELIQPTDLNDGNRDGYRLRVTVEKNLEDVIDQAEQMALNGELLVPPAPQEPQEFQAVPAPIVQEIPDGGAEPQMIQAPPQENFPDAGLDGGQDTVPLRAFGP